MDSLRVESLKRLKHPRNQLIKFCNRCFWVKENGKWKRLRGIHSAIQGRFFNPVDQKLIKRKKSSKNGLSDSEFNNKVSANEYASGLDGGAQIHSEIEMYCNDRAEWDRRVDITIEYLKRKKIAKTVLQTGKIQNGSGSWFRGIIPKKPMAMLHPCSVVAVSELKKHHLEPVVGEFPIFSHKMYATKIDIVCVNTLTKELVIVEVKSGYDDTFRSWTEPMKGELRKLLSNSPLSQAILQIFIPKCTLEYEYGIRASAMVLRVNKHEAELFHLPSQLEIASLRLYKWIKSEIINK